MSKTVVTANLATGVIADIASFETEPERLAMIEGIARCAVAVEGLDLCAYRWPEQRRELFDDNERAFRAAYGVLGVST